MIGELNISSQELLREFKKNLETVLSNKYEFIVSTRKNYKGILTTLTYLLKDKETNMAVFQWSKNFDVVKTEESVVEDLISEFLYSFFLIKSSKDILPNGSIREYTNIVDLIKK